MNRHQMEMYSRKHMMNWTWEFLPKSSIVTPFSGPPNPSFPIREVVRNDDMGSDYPSKPMSLYATIWDASTWATSGGKYKVNYAYQPFVSSYKDFVLQGCVVDPIQYPVPLPECVIVHSEWHLFKDSGRLKQALKMKFSRHQNYHRRSSRQKSRVLAAAAAAASGATAIMSYLGTGSCIREDSSMCFVESL
ncbi:putative xyloglucan endotransglucosylase/hydrolase protein 30 [Camellia lanceoleosa]|uniref:Xyloglucan endotransglucosylase/hydrolase protein 30 n=1 Tax=Camellia lanceoleosa TaxID=1840588 RepID=A0ACC0G3P6_9ERIC|nr:putative xyloglucan endotransglucosylase/hydrolase protein 30 [Camellia lanceoleosa]